MNSLVIALIVVSVVLLFGAGYWLGRRSRSAETFQNYVPVPGGTRPTVKFSYMV